MDLDRNILSRSQGVYTVSALCTSPTGPTRLHIAQTCLDRPTCPTNDPNVWTSDEIAAETIPKDDSNLKSP